MANQNPGFQIPNKIHIHMRPKMGTPFLLLFIGGFVISLYAYVIETTFLGNFFPRVPIVSALLSEPPKTKVPVPQVNTEEKQGVKTNAVAEIPPEFVRSERTMVLNMVHRKIKNCPIISAELQALDKRVVQAIIENRNVHCYPEQGNLDIQMLENYNLLDGLMRELSKNKIGRVFGCPKGFVVLKGLNPKGLISELSPR